MDSTRITAGLLLVLLIVPMLVTALIVLIILGRPVLFRQRRVGLNKKVFVIPKFRTMRDEYNSCGKLLEDDKRVTTITKWLRRLRLDEMPQLIAILRGDMVYVGPRPLLPETIENYGKLGALRCTVKPGVTGWAQVNGNNLLTNSQKLALDIWYIDHKNWVLDLRILALTVYTILMGERIDYKRLKEAETHLEAREKDCSHREKGNSYEDRRN